MSKKAKKVVAKKKVKSALPKESPRTKKKAKKVATKKVKATVKKKVKSVEKKKVKKTPPNKAKQRTVKTVRSAVSAKKVAKKVAQTPVKTKAKSVAKKSAKKVVAKKVKSPLNIALPKIEMHGEDLHLIPDHQPQKPITTIEVHAAENTFHHKEEVAFHQENKKVQQSIISQKNAKRFGRRTGRR